MISVKIPPFADTLQIFVGSLGQWVAQRFHCNSQHRLGRKPSTQSSNRGQESQRGSSDLRSNAWARSATACSAWVNWRSKCKASSEIKDFSGSPPSQGHRRVNLSASTALVGIGLLQRNAQAQRKGSQMRRKGKGKEGVEVPTWFGRVLQGLLVDI